MRYLRIEAVRSPEAPSLASRLVLAGLAAILPRANPDLDHLVDEVRLWWLEIEDTGEPCREIGFSASGVPVVIRPVGRNEGYLVEGSDDWSDSTDDSSEVAADFERIWSSVWPRFSHLETNA